MKIVLIGGMDRLKADYEKVAHSKGHKLKSISRDESGLESRIGEADKIIVFTNKVSHCARNKALRYGQAQGIPVQLAHSCGVSTLKNCLAISLKSRLTK